MSNLLEFIGKLSDIQNDSKIGPEEYKSAKELIEYLEHQIKYKTSSGVANMSDWDGRNLTQVLNNIKDTKTGVVSINDVDGKVILKSEDIEFIIDKEKHIIEFKVKGGGEKGLEKVHLLEKSDVKEGDKIELTLGDEINQLINISGYYLSQVPKEWSDVDNFSKESEKKFYPNENIEFNDAITLKATKTYDLTPKENNDYYITSEIDYQPNAKYMSINLARCFVPYFQQSDIDNFRNCGYNSFANPYEKLITIKDSYWYFHTQSTGLGKYQPFRNFIVDSECYLGDFDITFSSTQFLPGNAFGHVGVNSDTYIIRWGMCNLNNRGVVDYEHINKHNCAVIGSWDNKNVQVNFHGNEDTDKQVSGKPSETSNLFECRLSRTGGELIFEIKALDKKSLKEVAHYTSKCSFTGEGHPFFEICLPNSSSKEQTRTYVQGSHKYDLPNHAFIVNNIAKCWGIDQSTNVMYPKDISENWAAEEHKGDVIRNKATNYMNNRDEVNRYMGSENLQITTGIEPSKEYVSVNHTDVNESAIFMKEDYVLDYLDLEKMNWNSILEELLTGRHIEQSEICLTFSMDQGTTWYTYNLNDNKWESLTFENIENPTETDIAELLTNGISVRNVDNIKWETMPHRPFNTFRIGVGLNAYQTQIPYFKKLKTYGIIDKIWKPLVYGDNTINDYNFTIHYERKRVKIKFNNNFDKIKLYLSSANKKIIE